VDSTLKALAGLLLLAAQVSWTSRMRKDGIAAGDFKKTVKHLGDFGSGRNCVILAMAFLCDVLTVIWKSF
jgi:hypothetical protein